MADDLNFESLALYGSVLHKISHFQEAFKLEIWCFILDFAFIIVWMDEKFMQVTSLYDYHCNLLLCIVFCDQNSMRLVQSN
jgi:hypothetical protein